MIVDRSILDGMGLKDGDYIVLRVNHLPLEFNHKSHNDKGVLVSYNAGPRIKTQFYKYSEISEVTAAPKPYLPNRSGHSPNFKGVVGD